MPTHLVISASGAAPALREVRWASTETQKHPWKREGVTLVKVSAKWCGPCRTIHPKLLEKALPGVLDGMHVILCDVDEDTDILTDDMAIRALPTFILYEHGNLVDRLEGTNLEKMEGLLNKGRTRLLAQRPQEQEATQDDDYGHQEQPYPPRRPEAS